MKNNTVAVAAVITGRRFSASGALFFTKERATKEKAKTPPITMTRKRTMPGKESRYWVITVLKVRGAGAGVELICPTIAFMT